MEKFFSIRKKIKFLKDEELVVLYKKIKEKRIVDELYKRYSHLVLGTCMKLLKNKMDAEDLTIYIFSNLESKILTHEINYFKSWLYIVVRNECYMILRKNQPVKVEINDNFPLIESTQSEEDKDQELELQLMRLDKALEKLKSSQKMCIELFYLHKKSYEEIVKITGFTNLQVKSNIQNGKRNLRLIIEK